MKVYARKQSSPLKWVIAAILFIAVMTFTLSEVNGYPVPQKQGDHNNSGNNGTVPSANNSTKEGTGNRSPERGTSVVPEPGTILLMATGLGALYLFRKSRRTTA